MPEPVIEPDDVLVSLRRKRTEFTRLAVCGREYILVSELTAWLLSKAPFVAEGTSYDISWLSRLIRRCYPDGLSPFRAEELEEHQHILLFCILIEIGMGSQTHKFLPHVKSDHDLPIGLFGLVDVFTDMKEKGYLQTQDDPSSIAGTFDHVQWKYCAPKFRLHMDRSFLQKHILPIDVKQQINDKGGTADVWEIAVLEEFVATDLREVVKTSKYSGSDGRLVSIS